MSLVSKKDIHLTKGDLRVYVLNIEKSAEVIVPTGKRAAGEKQRSHKVGKGRTLNCVLIRKGIQ